MRERAHNPKVAGSNPAPATNLILTYEWLTMGGLRVAFLSVETLSSYGFDLSDKMGEVLRSVNPLTSLSTIRSVFGTLFGPDESLALTLRSSDLWLLSKRRHLIVHQRARVDQEYLDTTSESLSLGSELVVSPDQLAGHVIEVRKLGTALRETTGRGLLTNRSRGPS